MPKCTKCGIDFNTSHALHGHIRLKHKSEPNDNIEEGSRKKIKLNNASALAIERLRQIPHKSLADRVRAFQSGSKSDLNKTDTVRT